MSRQLRYEQIDQQWADVPMPDEEGGWEKMQQLLDKEDDGRRLLPPLPLQGCFGWSLLLVAAIAFTWMVVKNKMHDNTGAKAKPVSTTINKNPKADNHSSSTVARNSNSVPLTKTTQQISHTQIQKVVLKDGSHFSLSKSFATIEKAEAGTNKELTVSRNSLLEPPGKPETFTKKEADSRKQNIDTTLANTKKERDKIDSITSNNQLQATLPKLKARAAKRFAFSGGIGEQQVIPIDGQMAVPYSYYGRKGSLGDYIPSVYLRLQKERKWYLQAEFRYGAPQSVKELSYNRRTTLDSTGVNLTTTTMRLKKTYYHQFPLSFNYYITPRLSVGIGGIYSRFFGAVTEKEIKTQNLQTQAETVYTKIIPIDHFTDSFLYKTQVHYLIQADYQWKRFSFGLRYTRDLQPFIKFISPDGVIEEEKNQSLQLIARFRIW